MVDVIFHVGMGKTGSTSIQGALAQSAPELAQSGVKSLGMWLGMLGPEFDGFHGFQSFLKQPPEELEDAGQRLLQWILEEQERSATQVFVVSNEQYLENVSRLLPFFRPMLGRVRLRVLIFARPPATWLPSAYAQWGVVHKINIGPVLRFSAMSRRLIRQYGFIRKWHEAFENSVILREFDPQKDIVAEFGEVLGVHLRNSPTKLQARLPVSELLMRAAFNNSHSEPTLPQSFDRMISRALPPGSPERLSAKFSHIFDYSELPEIIAEYSEEFDYIERVFGVTLTGYPVPEAPRFELQEQSDELVGRLLDLVGSQSAQIDELNARIVRLEQSFGRDNGIS